MFRWSVSASLGQAHQAWRLPSASFCLEGNIASCKKFLLNLVRTKAVKSFIEHHPRSFYRTYHAMDLLNEINDVVRSNLNCETPEVVSLEMWEKTDSSCEKNDFRRRSTSGRSSRKRPPRRRRSGTSSAAAITGKLAFRQSQREGHKSHKRTCGFRFLENQRRQKAITSYFCVERQEICICAQTRSGR